MAASTSRAVVNRPRLFPAHLPFFAILPLRFLHRLPLHVARAIGTAGTQRLDVVLDIARTAARTLARARAEVRLLEFSGNGRIAVDFCFYNGGEPEQQS